MCGRLTRDPETYEQSELLRDIPNLAGIEATNNAPPKGQTPVVVKTRDGRNMVRLMRWGLRRPWSKPGMPTPSNARAETILEKPMFRDLIRSKRCLVPTNGYYEWRKIGNRSQPYHIRPTDSSISMFAGLYDAWINEDGTIAESYTLITTMPAESIAYIHDRMPVILARGDVATWLRRDVRDLDVILPLLRPYPSELLTSWPVSTRVNDPSADGPDLIEPVELSEPVEQLALV